jgi:MoaA/NifB/PqqE/SkfB family radical SAM enzyme
MTQLDIRFGNAGVPGATVPEIVPTRYKRKNPRPSEDMIFTEGMRYRCAWLEEGITVHSDGNISCGLDDPHAQRSFGNLRDRSIASILANPEYRVMQEKLWNGHHCAHCGHFRPVAHDSAPPPAQPLPRTSIVLETTVKCNLACPNPPCIPNNDAGETTRDGDFLDFAAFRIAIDQVAESLDTVHFYNYGEPFLNRRAEDMLAYLRERCPDALIVTSTNGIPLSNATRAKKAVAAAPDRIIFTISGATQESYARYHVNGRLDLALAGLKNACDAKREIGRERPKIIWRYLAFHWNDSKDEIERAVAIAEDYGVDEFSLYLTDTPLGARSMRLAPGSPNYYRFRRYIHLDSEGRLDHGYHCVLPDNAGLWPAEAVPELGLVRRMGSEATVVRPGEAGYINFDITTDLGAERPVQTVRIDAPWGSFRIELAYRIWRPVRLRIPLRFRRGDVVIKLTTDDYFLPVHCGPDHDPRCLGPMLRDPPAGETVPAWYARWWSHAAKAVAHRPSWRTPQ